MASESAIDGLVSQVRSYRNSGRIKEEVLSVLQQFQQSLYAKTSIFCKWSKNFVNELKWRKKCLFPFLFSSFPPFPLLFPLFFNMILVRNGKGYFFFRRTFSTKKKLIFLFSCLFLKHEVILEDYCSALRVRFRLYIVEETTISQCNFGSQKHSPMYLQCVL